ncbi:MAG: hypothetical protein ABI342_04055 [Nitrososphaera sp.]|jgi:hypothetical protein
MTRDSKPFLWNYIEREENDLKSSGGNERIKTASANEESKNSIIELV